MSARAARLLPLFFPAARRNDRRRGRARCEMKSNTVDDACFEDLGVNRSIEYLKTRKRMCTLNRYYAKYEKSNKN